MDSWRAPPDVYQLHFPDQLAYDRVDGWPAEATASAYSGPVPAKALPVPAHDSVRGDDAQQLAPPWAASRQYHPEQPIKRAQTGSLCGTLKYSELLAKGQILQS